jgi:hypothetical protein
LKSEESRGPMRVDEDARMKRMQVKRTRASKVVLSRDEASVAGGRHGRALCHKRREWKGGRMDGWMGKVRLGGCGEEAVVGLRGRRGGGWNWDRGWGIGLDLQLQEAEVTRVRQLRYDAPMENIPTMEVHRSKGCTRSSALSDQFTALRLRIRSVEGCSQGCTRPLT